jgi:hypothetical protein
MVQGRNSGARAGQGSRRLERQEAAQPTPRILETSSHCLPCERRSNHLQEVCIRDTRIMYPSTIDVVIGLAQRQAVNWPCLPTDRD